MKMVEGGTNISKKKKGRGKERVEHKQEKKEKKQEGGEGGTTRKKMELDPQLP